MSWLIAALAATSGLVSLLAREQQRWRMRTATFLAGDPRAGAFLFEHKGCAECHSIDRLGQGSSPGPGFQPLQHRSLDQFISSMWNHAPRMWERMKAREMTVPVLREQEMSDLFAFLYIACYTDEPGDPDRGRSLFATKNCIRCHAVAGQGGTLGPDLAKLSGIDTPIAWTQAMWNHAPVMKSHMAQLNLEWPHFADSEMNDLLAYVREVTGVPRSESRFFPADPGQGWRLFREKSCIACHTVEGEGGKIGPELGPRSDRRHTMVQFAGAMWNHFPAISRAMEEQHVEWPNFKGREMADLMAFLSRLRYFEPTGSPSTGKQVFAARGCSRCHGPAGEGSQFGPALRGQSGRYSSITIAAALWRHGPIMYARTQTLGVPWPTLQDEDVGALVAFLNADSGERRRG